MKVLIVALSLFVTAPAFAVNDFAKAEAKHVVALAMPGSEPTGGCDLQLSSEHAAANNAQLIGTSSGTVAYFKSVSGAGIYQSLEIRIYPGESLEETRAKLDEVAKSIGAGSVTVRGCY